VPPKSTDYPLLNDKYQTPNNMHKDDELI